jgi:large repetitive protein
VPPVGTTIRWFANTPPPTNTTPLTVAQAAAAPAGTYYGAFYDVSNNCYSPATKLSVATNNCPAITVNLSAGIISTLPAGSTLVWFTNSNHTGTAYSTPATAGAGTYYAFYYDAVLNCYSAASSPVIVTISACTNPDINAGSINSPISGNVSTNDNIPAGTTYGAPIAGSGNPTGATITMNPDGTYTFNTTQPGVYTYNIPVCAPGQSLPCPTSSLVITATNPAVNNNPPVVNTDIATTPSNTPVTVSILANDGPGNKGGVLGTPTILGGANPGATAVINGSGQLVYTPAPGFVGKDTITYQVCESPSGICKAAIVIVTVEAAAAVNSTVAADDYITTTGNIPATGNVKTNDSDPQGNTQTVTTQNLTIAGKGSFVLNSNGTYTFTPVSGFTGTVDLPYNTCDDGIPKACANATLHIVVTLAEVMDAEPDFNSTLINVPVTGNVSTNDIVPAGTTYGTPIAVAGNPNGLTPVMNSNGTYTFTSSVPGVFQFLVPVCTPGQSTGCAMELLTITVQNPTTANPPIANTDIATTLTNTAILINALANDAVGTPGRNLNPASVTLTDMNGAAAGISSNGGSATINTTTGAITYTPPAGFVGVDTLRYTVCDNGSPALCASAYQIITVEPVIAPNSTTAVDDYVQAQINTTLNGNVKTNDTDPQGHTQTVTPQVTQLAGKGTLILNSDGSYTFVPAANYTGPVEFTYTTCDDGTPQACASATLHILVKPKRPDFATTIDINALTFATAGVARDFIVNVREVVNAPSVGQVVVRILKIPAFDITYNPAATTVGVAGGTAVTNSDWLITETSTFIVCTLKTTASINSLAVNKLGFTVTRKQGVPENTSQSITATIAAGSGGDNNTLNNQYTVTITAQ